MPDDLRRFILTSIQSVPFVEAILLFMGQAGLSLDAPTVARRLYVDLSECLRDNVPWAGR